MVEHPVAICALLLVVLAALFHANKTRIGAAVYRFIPLLVFAYFVPTVLSNTGVIPLKSELYTFIKTWLLPASLVLLTLTVDIKGIARLGRPAVVLFLSGTLSIVVGGPIALLAFGWLLPADLGDQAWRGLAALSGSWIGGGANFVAIGESVNATESTMSMMVVVDVAVASVWMAILLFFAGRQRNIDARLGADRRALEQVRSRIEAFQAQVRRPTNLEDVLIILGIGIGAAVLAHTVAAYLPALGSVVNRFTWVVLIATTLGLLLSFTPARRLEGAGASAIGSAFLYLLVASIGAKAEFAKVLDAPSLVAIGAVWMCIHAACILLVTKFLRAPIFFAAVGSQANVGGAASAPIVAAAFHPALAPVGVLLAVGGYVVGTYAGVACAYLLEIAY